MKDPNDNFIVDRVKSVGYAFKGMWILVSTENSIKAQISVGLLMTILGFVMEISAVEWVIQLLTIGLVLVAEALNTGIEKVANFVQPNFDKKIGIIKDISAGAVAFAALLSFVIGLIIYLPKFMA